jgi:Bacterial CdiA-CT RNAse A domain
VPSGLAFALRSRVACVRRPDAESVESSREDGRARRARRAFIKLQRALDRKYRSDQPRVPAGNPDGGQWTSEDGGQGADDDRTLDLDVTGRTGRTGAPENERRYSVNLEEEDARGGHAVRDHVGKTKEELVEELDQDWKRWDVGRLQITNYRPAQGSFSSLIEANDFVNQTLRENQEKVDAVATGQAKRATLEKRFGYVTGYEAYRRESAVRQAACGQER